MAYLALLLVLIGLSALCWALHPILYICRHERAYAWGWKALALMVGMFICGYTIFALHLVTGRNLGFTEVLLSIILCGGGGFVVLVSYMSRSTLDKMDRIASSFEQQTLHDSLTGLPNRKALFITLDNTISARGRGKDSFSVMIMDLNGFKEINDTLGHQAGDVALQTIAPRFQNQLRGSDSLCRLGGDEFAVILPKTNETQALRVAHKLLSSCDQPIVIDGQHVQLGVSIGIAVSPDHAQLTERLMQFADVAMYEAKRKRTGVEVYHVGIDQHSPEKLVEPNLLKEAIHKHNIEVRFQPVLNRAGQVIALEAKHFWQTPTGQEHNAKYIIELAEKAGVVGDITQVCIHTAMSAFRDIKYELQALNNAKGIRLYFPVFHASLSLRNLQEVFDENLNTCEINEKEMVLLLSEISIWKQNREYLKRIESLANRGVGIGLNHFGSTGGSILLLQSLPVSLVKSDPVFCEKLVKEEANMAVLKAAVVLLKELGIELIMDGVPDKNILRFIRHFKIDGFQGNGISSALEKHDVVIWIKKQMQNEDWVKQERLD